MAVMRPTATGGFDILHFSSSSPSFRADARDDGGISADELCIRGTLVSTSSRLHIVMAGLVPAIHAYGTERGTWMPGTSRGMTTGTPSPPSSHCGKCQENVASKANFRHRREANNGYPT